MSVELNKDIPILYKNETGNTDFEVLVFAKNYTAKINSIQAYYCAWHTLRSQTTVRFNYPAELSVGAVYRCEGGQVNTAGPFKASLGSTWQITQPRMEDTPVLEEGKKYEYKLLCLHLFNLIVKHKPKNSNNTIVIRNIQPASWCGQTFDIGIYKSGRCIVTEPDVHTDNQINFLLQPRLYFAVARNVELGEIFKSLEWSIDHTEVDLTKYPNGMIMTLTEQPGGGKYVFTPTEMPPGR